VVPALHVVKKFVTRNWRNAKKELMMMEVFKRWGHTRRQ
jgi:hypothetical protein